MQTETVQIFGKGGFAREVATYIKAFIRPQEVIFAENDEIKDAIFSYPTIIAIGNGQVRKELVKKIKEDYDKWEQLSKFARYDFSEGWGENLIIGEGSIICPNTFMTTDITIGNHVIINIGCTIGHDVKIGDYTTISPGVNVSGNVEIGELCYIGTNAVIREKIKICDGVTIGAGAVVVKDITEPGTYVGNPAKPIPAKVIPMIPVESSSNENELTVREMRMLLEVAFNTGTLVHAQKLKGALNFLGYKIIKTNNNHG